MQTTARTSVILSPLANRQPAQTKALLSLANAIRKDARVRRAEADLRRFNPRLLDDPAASTRTPSHG